MTQSLPRRLWTYQAERFPLVQTVPLLTVFAAASVNVSAFLAGRPLPGIWAYVVAALLALGIFFQMRAFDEAKDLEDDRRYRPERPIPRGLVSLRTILGLAALVGAGMLALAWAWNPATRGLLLLVWLWLALMTAEFGAPAWLKARPLVYLLSHMVIMPLIDLMLTGIEWTAAGAAPAPALGWFLALSFANGCVLEIGRKVWAPESEREGVDTYSALWGPRRAAAVWLATAAVAYLLLVGLGQALGAVGVISAVGGIGLLLVALCAWRFRADPSPAWQGRVDKMSGLWLLVCYLAAGFLPLVAGI
ncbi:UbiA family prenyltransferase [Tropicimonas sediminicola]|uniref:4-hydroxybenzoate polyprenyltransferase n=1 Tax=Tropicimonas sediminicola TaxID=1031541 RepID=A0A239IEM6_9RHOB|nr:UbiA family prenyltransferase [Tropicimonas sediminicola]SNS90884.1 4-hydroxybenzoate polyprenyltransferase [Tropicimonas sediminicola]